MPDALLQALIQIPVVVVFIWYTLERDARDSKAYAARNEHWQCFLSAQQDAWQEFIVSQNAATMATLADVSHELGVVAEHLNQLHGIIERHDGAMRERMVKSDGK